MSTIIRLPGLIDPHVHLRDPEQTEKEDFYTGSSAAIAGGFTTIIGMPNNKTPITTEKRLDEKKTIAKKRIVCDIGFYFGSLGDNLNEFKKVQTKVKGLKLYLNETTGNFLIDKEKLKEIFVAWGDSPILLHAEDDAVSYIIEIVRQTGKRAHFCHISTASDLKQITKAKKDRLPISCGVTPHHLFLTENDTKHLGPFGRMKPYLKSKKDVEYLWGHLQEIDLIESDHAPHTKTEKNSDAPPFGVPGLETTLPLLLTAVSESKITIEDIVRLCYRNPSKIFNIQTNDTTYIEIDPNEKHQIKNDMLKTKCRWSPFNGWEMRGRVKTVVIRGTKVFADDTILKTPGFGHTL